MIFFKKRKEQTKSPLKSFGFWGIVLTIVVPIINNLFGYDFTNLITLISTTTGSGPQNFTDYFYLFTQAIGIIFSVLGLTNKNRKPLTWTDKQINL